MAARSAFVGGSARHGDWLLDSAAWRWQIAEAARRQRTRRPGCRDVCLLDQSRFVHLACTVILAYGESDLLLMPAEAPGLLRRLERYERTLKSCRPLRMAEEFSIVATLRYDLRRLLQLNRRHASRQSSETGAPNPRNDDGRADQARPSRSPLNPNQAWPPASGRRMTPCPQV